MHILKSYGICSLGQYVGIFEPRHEKLDFALYAKTKAQISCAVTAQLISAFVLATQIVRCLYFLSRNFNPLISSSGCAAQFVSDLIRNPEDRFSQVMAHFMVFTYYLSFCTVYIDVTA